MRLALHTIICCCLFTVVLPLRRDELNSSLKRFRTWLQSHWRRDLSSSVAAAVDRFPDGRVGAQQHKKATGMSPAPSFRPSVRAKRSVSSKATGCHLSTCVYHDLLDELYKIKNKPKDIKAPPNKMGRDGYGRRRRSLSRGAARHVSRHRRTCSVA